MSDGRVYWITGLSNSGKTTIGTALYYDLKSHGENVVILDGDLMKQIASGSAQVGYEQSDRLIRAKRYSLMAKLLADQGVWVIVCAIAMFDEIREWNRKNIKGYVEVFLNVSDSVLQQRDKKGLFRLEENVQYPKSPDIEINNDGTIAIGRIVEEIKSVVPDRDDYDRDRVYWNTFYKGLNGALEQPSGFAMEINKRLNPASHIMELGCGNGRDSLFFSAQGHFVVAIDGSDYSINQLKKIHRYDKNISFICDDFVKCKALYQMQYDCIYSRFTLHAISENQESELLRNIKDALSAGGRFCIEARTVRDDLFGMGKKVGHNAYEYNGHFRRFIDVREFEEKLESLGFDVLELEEARGFSKTKESDPILMRCIAQIKM